ncbi:MAG: hypothetical protein ABSB95_08605 [Dissulfurispiraceae bacterium]
MVNANNKIEDFIKKNKGIIIKIARKSLGRQFNEKEAMSIAYLAALQAKVYKRDQFQKTKDTTVFVWYLKKGFESIRGLDGGESLNQTWKPAYDNESRAIDFERLLLLSGENEGSVNHRYSRHAEYGIEPASEAKSEFHVCIKSFREKTISKKTLDTLRLLTHQQHSIPAISELEKMYGCTRRGALSNKILKELISEISDMGMKLFKAECMNGTLSVIVACAGSKEEADRYFSEYGKVLKCSQLMMPGISE